jgi:ubiquinone/menaquinone biosynthesis C-methylase UbiE
MTANATSDMSPATANVAAAFDQAADRYDTHGPQFAAPVAERLVDLAGLVPGWRVLDAGCGAGAVTIRAARAVIPGGQVTGIDLAPAMLKRAAAEARRRQLGHLITLRQADAADPPFPPRSFDAVLASLLLYLLPDPSAALVRWRDLLAPGGTLGFSWGSGPADARWAPVFAAVDAHAPAQSGFFSYVRRLPRPTVMHAVLERYGFTDVTMTTEVVSVRYASPQQWWLASVSEGPWVAWQHIPRSRLPAARAEALRLLEPLREADGTLTRHVPMTYAICRVPGTSTSGA